MFWTIISSVFTSLITTRFTYHGDTLKELRKSRETLYTEVFKNIERLINDTELVFQDEFINSLVESKYKVKLIASDRVVSAYEKLFSFCTKQKSEYDDFLLKNAPCREYVSQLIKNVLIEMRYDVGNHPLQRFIIGVKDRYEHLKAKAQVIIETKKSERKKEVL